MFSRSFLVGRLSLAHISARLSKNGHIQRLSPHKLAICAALSSLSCSCDLYSNYCATILADHFQAGMEIAAKSPSSLRPVYDGDLVCLSLLSCSHN
jgi:hypothetical protein